ncbi:MAG: glycosyltransferase family 4 protein [Candidatus Eisenbacteria bacterium]|nr:glycosyltransferase family 4 protein [Candidatus Eisenbacteria bacterium]
MTGLFPLCYVASVFTTAGPIREGGRIDGLRILVVNWRDGKNPEAGGAEVHLHEIFGRIAAMGNSVTLLAHRFPGALEEEYVGGVRVLRVGGKFDFHFHVLPAWFRRLRREGYDVVVEDLNKLPFFLPLAVRVPCGAILHHFFGSSIWKETNPLFAAYVGAGEWVVRHTYRKIPFCVVSESTADELRRNGFADERIRIIHNAVDHDLYKPDRSVEPAPGRILYLGRVKKYKGIDLILHALVRIRREIPEAHLVVVGQGDDLPRLHRLKDRLGLADAVSFHGFVDTATKVDLLRRAMVMVTPSPKEGWGVTTIEGNACGTPVVASDAPGLRDAVRDGRTGFLFPYGDVEAMADRVRRLLTDRELRRRFSEEAVLWAGRFRWDRSAEETLEWLRALAGRGEER